MSELEPYFCRMRISLHASQDNWETFCLFEAIERISELLLKFSISVGPARQIMAGSVVHFLTV